MPLFLFIWYYIVHTVHSFKSRISNSGRNANWATPYPTELRRTVLSYAAPLLSYAATYWSTQHPTELRRNLPSYAAPVYFYYCLSSTILFVDFFSFSPLFPFLNWVLRIRWPFLQLFVLIKTIFVVKFCCNTIFFCYIVKPLCHFMYSYLFYCRVILCSSC